MTDELRDLLTRRAEDALPAPPDPTVWARARRAKRRREALAAAAAGLAVFALVAVAGVAWPDRSRPDPSPVVEPSIPSLVRGVDGDGGLPLETDLSVGPASVAIANPEGAFVVTADDGEYHRLDLPGFDASLYDVPEVRRTGMVGLTLSPDGTRLAYGFHGPMPRETGQEHGFVRSGVRVLDLNTGHVETLMGNQPLPAKYMGIVNANDFLWAVVPYGIRWSPDGRYLAYEQVWRVASGEGRPEPLVVAGLRGAYRDFGYSAPTLYDTVDRTDVSLFRDLDSYLNWGLGSPGIVSNSGMLLKAGSWVNAVRPGRPIFGWELPGARGVADGYTSGLLGGDRRAFLETRYPSNRLLRVDLRTGATERVRLDIGRSRVDLLGWIGRGQALAEVHRGTGGAEWEEDGDLVVLDLSDSTAQRTTVEPAVVGRIDTRGTDSSFTFATDHATVSNPTHDFATSSDVDEDKASGASQPGGDDETGLDPRWLAVGFLGGLAAAVVAVRTLRRPIRPS